MTTPAETRLRIHKAITDILFDLALDPTDEITEDEYRATREGMENLADMLFEVFGFEVTEVTEENGYTTALVELRLLSDEN